MDDAAEEDLRAIYAYIAEQSDQITAFNYIRRILEWSRSLETFPMRGASREDIRKGCASQALSDEYLSDLQSPEGAHES